MLSPIGYSDYKVYFKDYLSQQLTRGGVGRLAKIFDCDRTYVSQVLYGKADLTPDHVVQFCEFNGFKDLDADFLLNLLLKNRSAKSSAKKYFENRIQKYADESSQLSKKFSKKKDGDADLSAEDKNTYYSDVNYSLIHILTSNANYQQAQSISMKLSLGEKAVLQILHRLVKMGLVFFKENRFIHSGKIIYLEQNSPQILNLHFHARMLALQRSKEGLGLHFSNVFTADKKDITEIKMKLSQMIEEIRNKIHKSGTEELGLLCFDFLAL